ncbi:H-NS family nucleoid-associated regulatory protein [Methylomonas sp. TEB]|uniref:H-NS histone family protein n=1 Tax=Methylomonas sp. TEB TaxID=3398229 RepID=UPI0039F4C774
MTTKNTNDKTDALETKSIAELQELFANTQRLLEAKQGEIRESAVQKIQQIALEAGIKVFIREPRKRSDTPVKIYQHPDDASLTWTSKKAGAKPKWLSDFLKNGRKLEEFEVKAAPEAATTA